MTKISEVTRRHRDGSVDYVARVYLGRHGLDSVIGLICQSDELLRRRWYTSTANEDGIWEIRINRIKPGTGLYFRLELNNGQRIPIVPHGESDVVSGVVRIPDYLPEWWQQEPDSCFSERKQAPRLAILLEQTLEGLLADYEDGIYFTDAIEELLDWGIASRIMQTKIPEEIRDLGYNEVMFPLFASVADRTHLDPKFNYLVYNVSADWQLGTASELRGLVQRFRACGIELVPDLVFVHQVANPYDGCSDDIGERCNGLRPLQDPDPFLFRKYGTWHFDLEDPIVREILIDKIIETILILGLRLIRVDYIDGLLMQSVNKPINYGSLLLQELKLRIDDQCPWLRVIGEAFQTAFDPAVQSLIDSAYSPRGFALLDLLLSPGASMQHLTSRCVDGLTRTVNEFNQQCFRESNYSQLHDECWHDDWISRGRPQTPWAYGMMPLGLAEKRVDELLLHGWIEASSAVETAVSLMLLIRNLGLACSFTRWMETSGCLSLDHGRLDDPGHWRFPWSPSGGLSKVMFPATGLTPKRREQVLAIAQNNVAAANKLISKLFIDANNPIGPPLRMVHGDVNNGLAGFVRWSQHYPNPALVLVNLSPRPAGIEMGYAISLASAGWSLVNQPPMMQAVTLPLLADDGQPLILSLSRDSAGEYQLSRPLHGYETALFEVPIHGS